jgi:hypothetical protein
MSKLRASISFQHKVDEVKIIQQQKLRESIAEPIAPVIINENDETPINLETQKENSINIQDDISEDEEDNNEAQVSSNWNSLINMWVELLLQEEEAENQTEEEDDNVEIDDFLLNRTHPALDNEAKWNIENIFIDNLDAPFFTNESLNN